MVVNGAKKFVPVFVDTLSDHKTTKRFGENYGSYPVLRVHDHAGQEIGGRIDGNKVAGRIPVSRILDQFKAATLEFEKQKVKSGPGS